MEPNANGGSCLQRLNRSMFSKASLEIIHEIQSSQRSAHQHNTHTHKPPTWTHSYKEKTIHMNPHNTWVLHDWLYFLWRVGGGENVHLPDPQITLLVVYGEGLIIIRIPYRKKEVIIFYSFSVLWLVSAFWHHAAPKRDNTSTQLSHASCVLIHFPPLGLSIEMISDSCTRSDRFSTVDMQCFWPSDVSHTLKEQQI